MTLVQALDMLGNTKWRVNRRVLNVVESIWDRGGNIAGLVNREDVSTYLSFILKKHLFFSYGSLVIRFKIKIGS